MFDVGFWEVLVIGVLALVVVGPERLPRLARTVGLWVGRARHAFYSVRDEIEREANAEGLRDTQRAIRDSMKETEHSMRRSMQETENEIRQDTPSSGPAADETADGEKGGQSEGETHTAPEGDVTGETDGDARRNTEHG